MEEEILSIIIVNYNNPDLIDSCLNSINKHIGSIKKEIIIVDNNSSIQNLAAYHENYPEIKVIYLPENMGFGYANNVGVKNAVGDVVLLLNSDAEFIDNSFEEMLSQFRSSGLSEIWGPRLIWPDGRFQNSYSREINFFDFLATYSLLAFLFRKSKIAYNHKYENQEFIKATHVEVIYATAILVSRHNFNEINGFSNKYFMYFEDVEFCDRFRSQLLGKIIFYPRCTLVHRVKGSSNSGFSVNWEYLKSKYVYADDRFGFFNTLFFKIIDYSLSYIKFIIFRIKIKLFNN
jgi:GT2 family glycosyltransferase